MEQSLLDILDLRELGGELLKIRQAVRSGRNTMVFTSNYQERIHISAGLERSVLFVVSDKTKAREAYSRLSEFSDRVGLLTEKEGTLVYRKVTSRIDNVDRTATLYKLASGELDILVTTADAIMQYLPKPQDIMSSVVNVSVDDILDKSELAKKLTVMGYGRVEIVEEAGDFSIKGDICSVFPHNSDTPYTISFFDDVVESIKSYDVSTGKSLEKLTKIEIFSPLDPIFGNADIQSIINTAKKSAKNYIGHAKDRAYEIIDELQTKFDSGEKTGYNWLLPFCIDKMCGIDNYLDEKSIVVFDEPKAIYDHAKLSFVDYHNRCTNLIGEGEITVEHKQNFMSQDVLGDLARNYATLGFSNIASSNPIFAPADIYRLDNPPVRAYYADINTLFKDVRHYNREKYKVVLCCGDEYTARSIVSSLYDSSVFADYTERVDASRIGVQVTPFSLSHGMCYPKSKVIVIGKYDITRKREIHKTTSRKKTNVFNMPKVGDYVVHDTQGVGICSGVEQIETFGVKRDFVVINYADNDKLYIAVEDMDKLQRYSGSDTLPKLNKLGGKEFQKLKDRVKASVKEMAFDLLELYKTRQNLKGHKYAPDTVWQQEFEDAFEYDETDDQLKAIEDIKSDMERGVVMDRLLCGDVGYGKTEVALRAVFKTVMEGKQAAILAPTTILARQHYDTAVERFSESGLKCALLSRFQSKQEIDEELKRIKKGEVSVIIATHRLLSSDVEFQDLGLLVLDEEQRFGVEHKEKLKALKNNINVLTLSATPIPRTLNMALTGIRDISVLETPPKERIPVETYVTELTDGLLADVITRELNRDGQVYVLYNRVQGIDKMAEHIKELVPEAKVVVGHGQMTDSGLENAIDKFYSKEANVLVCTTIIENGINLPDANTLVVCEADRLGLSALYQLRGRVGRSNKHAYAYFTTRQGKVLTGDALKRLTAIMEYTDFGSGFKIAMRDLEIRGAGNVLGKEQHGHIAKVGYDMYCKLLREAVDEASGSEIIKSNDVELKVDIDAYIDGKYISDNDEKIKIYKNIAELSNIAECEEMNSMLTDRYGTPEEGLVNLMKLAVIKNMSGGIGAKRVNIRNGGMQIVFGVDVFRNEGVITAISDMQDVCSLSVSDEPMVVFDVKMADTKQKLDMLIKFLQKTSK